MAQASQDSDRVFKVLLLGDEGVGKTSLVKWCQHGDIEPEANETGVYRYGLNVVNSAAMTFLVKFDVWDIPGSIEFGAEKDQYLQGIDAVIIMFDLQRPATYDSVPFWWGTIPEPIRSGDTRVPVVLCGNKVDLPYRRMGSQLITFHRENYLQYYDISAKVGLNLSKIFVWIARRVRGDQDLALPDDFVPDLLPVQLQSQELDQPEHPKLNLAPLAIPDPHPGDFTLQNIRPQLEAMIARLNSVPQIEIGLEEIGGPTPEFEIEEAKRFANGVLPTGVEEFYRQIRSFRLEWKYKLSPGDKRNIAGYINILPIREVFGDNWRDSIWFPLPEGIEPNPDDEWRFRFRKVLPFDPFTPEACGSFIQEPKDGSIPEDCIAFHYCGEDLVRTRYTFTEYIERLLMSYGYAYWICSLFSPSGKGSETDKTQCFLSEIYGPGVSERYFNRSRVEETDSKRISTIL